MMYGAPGSFSQIPVPQGQLAPMQIPKAIVRIGEQCVWSTYQYADGATLAGNQDNIFTTQMSLVGQGFGAQLSIAETNVRVGGMMPGGQAFTVYAIALQPYYPDGFPVVRADLQNIENHLVLVWDFLQTKIEISPVQLIGAGGGIFGSTADTGANEGGLGGSRIILNHGAGQVWIYQNHPVALPAGITFNLLYWWGRNAVVVQGGSNNSALNLRTCLIGVFETAIEVG